ncbi:Kunitz-type serine protease inhibitor B1 [Pseudolycoriella hygida]|uniref:Kunitz-type serine protease inhibitor B1 n=1 Tax=Pseudolycoriella hygida TaxID=35572 RepID=A0A9Q0N1B6_9DIPT|nr:Kunitz-type serine protease inhibitor B1 [Pseudolycoriella hygida]
MKFTLLIGLVVIIAVSAQHNHHGGHGSHRDELHPCAQPKFELTEGQIACLAHISAWYHDHPSGECKEYFYDGCNKSKNHFESKEQCDKTCADWHQEHKDHHYGSH